MARLGAGDTGGETIEEDVKDSTMGADAGADTTVEERADEIQETGDEDTNVTAPAPEPSQPARGRGDEGSGPSSTAPEPAPEPDQPARGRGDEGSGPSSTAPEPAPQTDPTDGIAAGLGTREGAEDAIESIEGATSEDAKTFQEQTDAEIDPGVLEAYKGERVEGIGDTRGKTTQAGLLGQQQEETLQALAQDYDEFTQSAFGVEGSTGAGRFVRSFGASAAGLANVPAAAVGIETGLETIAKTPEVVAQEGFADTAETFVAGGQAVGESAGAALREDPVGATGAAAGEITGAFVGGAAAFKAVEKAGDVRRTTNLATKADVDLEDITTEKGAQGELPKFETDPDAPTYKAVEEVETRAADNPDVVTQGTGGEGTIYHGTQDDFGTEFDVGEGASELPGIFTSPEASPIALQGTGTSSTLSVPKPRLPKLGGKSDRFLGLPGDDVAAIPSGAGGAGYAVRQGDDVVETGLGRGQAKALAEGMDDADVAPDPTTSGYEFLTEGADEGVPYVRPEGQRTTELEAIYAPGSEFAKTGTVGVRVGRKQIPGTDVDIPGTGRKVPLDLFERTGTSVSDDVAEAGAKNLEDLTPGEAQSLESIADDLTRLGDEGSVAAGGGLSGVGVTAATPSTVGVSAMDLESTTSTINGDITSTGTTNSGATSQPTTGTTGKITPTETGTGTSGTGTGTGTGTGSTSTPPSGTGTPPSDSTGAPTTPPPASAPPSSGAPSSGAPSSGPPTSSPPTSSPPTSPPPFTPTDAPPTRRPVDFDSDDSDDERKKRVPLAELDTGTFDNPALAPDELGQFEEDLLRDL